MDVQVRRGDVATRREAVALGVFEATRRPDGAAAAVDRATGGAVAAALRHGGFRGRFLETLTLFPTRGPARVILIGLGPPRALDLHRVRQVAARAVRVAAALPVNRLATVVHGAGAGGLDPAAAAQAVAEGSVLGRYRHTAYRSAAEPVRLARVELVERDPARARAAAAAVARGVAWAEAVTLARDLARTPGQDLPPLGLATRAAEVARGTGARAVIHDARALERLGMSGVLAVGRGSVHPPCFVVLERTPRGRPRGTTPTVVLIGKGVTFDTGGLSLKPRENMNRMKYDMAGAAAVVGVFAALPTLDPPFRVVGLIPAAENMPGSRALKPGDILRARDGTTIEVTNTDAEGRLLLADALGYARGLAPDAVVDLATLTGAISIALGHHAAGLFTADDALAAALLASAARTGERLWRMPLGEEYLDEMRGDAADLVNSAAREGGASLAASFLMHFARGMRWAHLDIASTAWTYKDRPLEPPGPNGFGVRLLLDWLAGWTPASAAAPPSAPAPSSRPGGRARR